MSSHRLLTTVASVSLVLSVPGTIAAQEEGDFIIHSADYPMEALENLTDGDLTALSGLLQRPIADLIDNAARYGGELETIVLTVRGDWVRGDMDPVSRLYVVVDPKGMVTMVNGARGMYADIDDQALSGMMPGGPPQGPDGINPAEMMRRAMGDRGEPPKIEYRTVRAADCGGEAVEATRGGPIGNLEDWTPGQERIHAIACLEDNPALHKTVTSFMKRMEQFSSMGGQQPEDAEDEIQKEWMKAKVPSWTKWIFAGGMYSPDASARFERMEFRKRQVDPGVFTEHRDKQYRKVSVMELLQSMGN